MSSNINIFQECIFTQAFKICIDKGETAISQDENKQRNAKNQIEMLQIKHFTYCTEAYNLEIFFEKTIRDSLYDIVHVIPYPSIFKRRRLGDKLYSSFL